MRISYAEIRKIINGLGVDSFNRFPIFLNLVPYLKGRKYWYALRHSYDESDNLFHYAHLVKAAFLKAEPERRFLMDVRERNYLKKLPEQIKIYRGMTEQELEGKSFGVSWTLKKEVAEFFAFDYWRNITTAHLKKTVHEITINKSDVIAFLNDRREYEIIYISDPLNIDEDAAEYISSNAPAYND